MDDHKNAELRGVLSPVKKLAEDLNIAVVLVSQLRKSPGNNAKHLVSGSIAYVGACRANFVFVRDRDDPSGHRVFMLDNGCNLSASVPTLAFQIQKSGDATTVTWEPDAVQITADEAIAAGSQDQQDYSDKRECERWLCEMLHDGPVHSKLVYKAAADEGFSEDRTKRALRNIGGKAIKVGFGKSATWMRSLPDTSSLPSDRPKEALVERREPTA